MIRKFFRLQLMSFLVSLAVCIGANGRTLHVSTDVCHEAGSLIGKLRSADQRKRERAKRLIVIFAGRSSSARECVIDRTVKIVSEVSTSADRGVELFWKSPSRFEEWSGATDILGTLKAPQAIDPLIDCLDCNDGRFGLGIGRFPATKAIIRFGSQAVPKLEAALQQKPPGIRIMIVQALHAIGGEKAKLILLEALKSETDKSVVDTIRNVLLSWKPQVRARHSQNNNFKNGSVVRQDKVGRMTT